MCERAIRPGFRSETTLVALAQAGDEEAVAYLLADHPPLRNLIGSLARRLDPEGSTRQDLVSVGRLEALRALQRFRADSGARFTTFIYRRLRGAMLGALYGKEVRRIGGGAAVRLVSADAADESEFGWEEGLANRDPLWGREPGYERVERGDQPATLRLIVEGLPVEQRGVIEDIFWRDETHAEVARRRGVSRPAVTQMMGRALARAAQHLDSVRDDLAA
jgi:RNA polymerase sigma factor (sigma-70 family)